MSAVISPIKWVIIMVTLPATPPISTLNLNP